MGFKQMYSGINFADLTMKDSMEKNRCPASLLDIAVFIDWNDIGNMLMSHYTVGTSN